jgi:hypothetical protein
MFRKNPILVLAIIILLFGAVPAALAQGGGEVDDEGNNNLRLVCLVGFGCGYTALSDLNLDTGFPKGHFVIEDVIDMPPAEGEYNFTYPGAGLICDGTEFNTQPEDSVGSFEYLDEDGELILASGLASESAELTRRAPGLYAGTLTLTDAGGTGNYSIFVMTTGETSVKGTVMGTLTSPDGTCEFWVFYLGEQ